MNITGYTESSGRACQSAISSTILSVILEMVSFETLAPYTSARWALTSPVVIPFAVNDSTIWSTPFNRRWRFFTITGSKLPSRSRGTLTSTGPIFVVTVFDLAPLRSFDVTFVPLWSRFG